MDPGETLVHVTSNRLRLAEFHFLPSWLAEMLPLIDSGLISDPAGIIAIGEELFEAHAGAMEAFRVSRTDPAMAYQMLGQKFKG